MVQVEVQVGVKMSVFLTEIPARGGARQLTVAKASPAAAFGTPAR